MQTALKMENPLENDPGFDMTPIVGVHLFGAMSERRVTLRRNFQGFGYCLIVGFLLSFNVEELLILSFIERSSSK